MSKRYGRNQRRKHRETIALLREAIGKRELEAVKQKRRADQLEEELANWNDEIIHLLGNHTAFQRTIPMLKVRDLDDFRRMAAPPDMRAAMRVALMADGPLMPESMTVEVLLMHKLFLTIEHDIGMLRNFVRLRIEDTRHNACYALSDDLLRSRGMSERDVEWMAVKIAREMVYLMNKNTSRP